jgi:hypothetical protein
MTNRGCVIELSNTQLSHQILETIKELRNLDRGTVQWDGATADLRDMFDERRARKTEGSW